MGLQVLPIPDLACASVHAPDTACPISHSRLGRHAYNDEDAAGGPAHQAFAPGTSLEEDVVAGRTAKARDLAREDRAVGVEPFEASYGAGFEAQEDRPEAIECEVAEDGGGLRLHVRLLRSRGDAGPLGGRMGGECPARNPSRRRAESGSCVAGPSGSMAAPVRDPAAPQRPSPRQPDAGRPAWRSTCGACCEAVRESVMELNRNEHAH